MINKLKNLIELEKEAYLELMAVARQGKKLIFILIKIFENYQEKKRVHLMRVLEK